MTIKQLSRYLLDEELSERYLLEEGVLKTYSSCPACNSTRIGRVRRHRNKCYDCKYEWNIRKGSFLEGSHINLSDFIGCLKFFSDEIPAYRCAAELEISPAVVNDLYQEFRERLFGPIEDLPADRKDLVLNMTYNNKAISISLSRGSINKAGSSSLIINRKKNKDYDYYYELIYKNLRVKTFLNSISRIDELDDFYRYCQEKLLTFRGRDIKLLLWKLHELVFRYNNRHEDMLDMLISKF